MSFTVTYLIPNMAGSSTATAPMTITNATDFMVDNDFVVFLDANRGAVAVVPVALHPVITRQ